LDFVYRARLLHLGDDVIFSRIGFVDDRSAKIVLRRPGAASVLLEYKPEGAEQWIHGSVQRFSNITDYVETILLRDLSEDTLYEYRTNTSLHGSFQTAAPYPKRWSMVSSSFISPGFPYNPVGSSLEIPGLKHLSQYVQSRSIDFMLFLGDFIYIDLPLPQRQTNIDYRRAYRRVYASPSWTPALRNLPFIHTYDDHEFENDWASNTTGIFWNAVEPFQHYQGNANPRSDFNDSYFTFKRGDVHFFVMDARKYRSSPEVVDGPDKTMLGRKQLADLQHWLSTSPGLKVVVSSVPFTRNWRGPESADSWAGYLHERQKILQAMRESQRVIIISGVSLQSLFVWARALTYHQDRHEHATTEFPSPDGKSKVIEFSTSPLSQFYQPFERMYQQIEDTDVAIYHHPWGISKFGAFHFDTSRENKWTVEFELIVDGRKVWSTVVHFPR
jgi:alkaline phosphatase D